ncbi:MULTISPECIES: hypothetical protein [Chromobacterium]|uniref:Uncharacterized protein n=1 Tax=Chromobacterium piscinae TaxID=686831 RepID=A0ABV0H6I5_9NEIS|nr:MULTISPECIES: hypothetical protein [Chromobacterium]MBX9298632.1 hypothetical protein [Chromobacterium vaccinii]MBX9347679.1 hypothetical protein [Chromobacterium vaccinii]MBX9357537.1 hypothetical protein [Chromobacterium vaccinii]MCD4505709.1 hypothetical protein [Chromobacterium piscinae]MCD5328062.1 hypothetical protein [Chromobacterium piscinae]
MHDLQFIREHKSQINHALKPFHLHHLRYVPDVCAGNADLVLLIAPSPDTSYFDMFQMEERLTEQLGVSVQLISENGLSKQERQQLLEIAQEI